MMGKKRNLLATGAGSRKARRKEERMAKKKNRGGQSQQEQEQEQEQKKTKSSDEMTSLTSSKVKVTSNFCSNKSILKKESKFKIDKKKTAAVTNTDNDPYAHLDPITAAAMRADDAEIVMLEERLAFSSSGKKGGKDKLLKEFSKLEGFGDSFGGFLDDLDRIASGRDLQGNNGKGVMNNESYSDEEPTHVNHLDDGDSLSEEQTIESSSDSESRGTYSDDDDVNDEESLNDENNDDTSLKQKDTSEKEQDQEVAVKIESQSDSDSKSSHGSEVLGDDQNESQSISEQSQSDGADDFKYDNDQELHDHAYRPTAGEDIYGNQIVNNATTSKPSKYVPPHLRKKANTSHSVKTNMALEKTSKTNNCLSDPETLTAINRKLNGMLNRLSEETLDSVSKQLIGLYREFSVNDVNSCLQEKVMQACVHSSQIMKSLIPVFCALLASVHIHVGNDVGGFLLEALVTNFLQTQKIARGSVSIDEEGYSKECSNLLLILCYLYSFQVVHCTLIYDIVRDLIKSFHEVDVELLLLLLSHCGFQLRSDDPTALKDIVLLVQGRAIESTKKSKSDDNQNAPASSRVSFMIEAITDLKNNKRKKHDEARLEKIARFKKFVGRMKSAAFSNNPSGDSCMRVTLRDILYIEKKGRWWKVGASWVGNQYNTEGNSEKLAVTGSNDTEKKLLKLAAKQHMNTDIRRSIFCILMNSADCNDAFEKIVRLNLKGKQDREIVRVLVHCCSQEKSYNPFYAFLAVRLCEFQPKAKFTFQLTFWDFFKQLNSSMKSRKAANLGKLLAHLVFQNVLSTMVLKALDMSNLSENGVIFVTIFITQLFDICSEPFDVSQFFATIPKEDTEGSALRDSLSVFFQRYLKKHPKNKKNSRFRSCFKVVVKICDDGGI